MTCRKCMRQATPLTAVRRARNGVVCEQKRPLCTAGSAQIQSIGKNDYVYFYAGIIDFG